ncbi:uncharacterized protein SPPG_08231 [Spizellomyces punctatus DAOM BR117]|uniref:Uncharacterized protein n=1 Tax=Spizellomyces punctatus (strain DAOM BR117) TaxID=645134 RepID=A0A0L0H6G7_SPIPD|nr:uncharacterized protein SPPG_08231 [Spizellomyces punctatus DAOM BR117]KNC96328.1 hypothetical protein SPPG_08231 [Spizellomyces punctatus DAOM BR117]|eukprot:XP_016604368.1 hypothetical protein SPPG_08231 [Spizellomyces punctatus DAOM BR117]
MVSLFSHAHDKVIWGGADFQLFEQGRARKGTWLKTAHAGTQSRKQKQPTTQAETDFIIGIGRERAKSYFLPLVSSPPTLFIGLLFYFPFTPVHTRSTHGESERAFLSSFVKFVSPLLLSLTDNTRCLLFHHLSSSSSRHFFLFSPCTMRIRIEDLVNSSSSSSSSPPPPVPLPLVSPRSLPLDPVSTLTRPCLRDSFQRHSSDYYLPPSPLPSPSLDVLDRHHWVDFDFDFRGRRHGDPRDLGS